MFTQLDLDFQHTALRAKFPNMITRFDLVCDSGYKILSAIAAVERPFISLCKKFHKSPSFAQKKKITIDKYAPRVVIFKINKSYQKYKYF